MREAQESKLKSQLRAVAEEQNRTINDVWKQLVLERFLARLSQSPHRQHLIFKGALLLARYIAIGRETSDADFLLRALKGNEESMKKATLEISAIDLSDGFLFSFKSMEILDQPHMEYPGYRIFLSAVFGKMRDTIGLDIGIGDPVEPKAIPIKLLRMKDKSIFESEIILIAYPPETILSEKLESIFRRGGTTSRMKDFHDAIMLFRNGQLFEKDRFQMAVKTTFDHRGTAFNPPLTYDAKELLVLQTRWEAHLRGLAKKPTRPVLPDNFLEVVEELNKFLLQISEKEKS